LVIGTTWALVAHAVGAVPASVDTTPSHGLFAESDRLIRGSISISVLTIGFQASGMISKRGSLTSVPSVTETTFSTLSATIPIPDLTKMMTATTRSGVNFVGMSESVTAVVAMPHDL